MQDNINIIPGSIPSFLKGPSDIPSTLLLGHLLTIPVSLVLIVAYRVGTYLPTLISRSPLFTNISIACFGITSFRLRLPGLYFCFVQVISGKSPSICPSVYPFLDQTSRRGRSTQDILMMVGKECRLRLLTMIDGVCPILSCML